MGSIPVIDAKPMDFTSHTCSSYLNVCDMCSTYARFDSFLQYIYAVLVLLQYLPISNLEIYLDFLSDLMMYFDVTKYFQICTKNEKKNYIQNLCQENLCLQFSRACSLSR